jgi:hypothetical protein
MTKRAKRWTSSVARHLLAFAQADDVERAISFIVERLTAGVPCPPTDLDALRIRLDVTACDSVPELPVAGRLIPDTGGGYRLEFASDLSRGRARFTVAHELGHAFFQTNWPRLPRQGRELERLCDMFATEVLLPRAAVVQLVQGTPTLADVFMLSRAFQTSVAATAIRLTELFRLSAFEIQDGEVLWSSGPFRPGPRFEMRPGFRDALAASKRREPGQEDVTVELGRVTQRSILEWRPVGIGGRALFLVRPVQRSMARAAEIQSR